MFSQEPRTLTRTPVGHNGQGVWQHTQSSFLGIEAHVQPPLASGSLGHHLGDAEAGGETLSGPSEPTRVLQERVWGRHLPCVSFRRYGHRMSLEGSGEAVGRGL